MSALEASSDIQMTPFSTGALFLSRGLSCQKRARSRAFPTPYFSVVEKKWHSRGILLLLLLLLSRFSRVRLCNPINGSPPGSPVPGILQARPLEWVAISFSNAWRWKVKGKSLSRVWLFATPWTAAHQAPPSMGFSRQEYWSGLPSPSPLEAYRPALIPVASFSCVKQCKFLKNCGLVSSSIYWR